VAWEEGGRRRQDPGPAPPPPDSETTPFARPANPLEFPFVPSTLASIRARRLYALSTDGYRHHFSTICISSSLTTDDMFVDGPDGKSTSSNRITDSASSFLELSGRFDREPFLKPMVTWNLSQIIGNYSEVSEALHGSRFEWGLDGPTFGVPGLRW
jgi:hypothetical protein